MDTNFSLDIRDGDGKGGAFFLSLTAGVGSCHRAASAQLCSTWSQAPGDQDAPLVSPSTPLEPGRCVPLSLCVPSAVLDSRDDTKTAPVSIKMAHFLQCLHLVINPWDF